MTPHFSWEEAQTTETGLQNNPPASIKPDIINTAWRLEAVRAAFGGKPLVIKSWFRSPVVNHKVGGAVGSDHLFGLAVDFHIEGLASDKAADDLHQWCVRSGFPVDQIITHQSRGHIHIGFGKRFRCERLRLP